MSKPVTYIKCKRKQIKNRKYFEKYKNIKSKRENEE